MRFSLYYDENIMHILDNTESGDKKVRLLGISVSNFVDESCKMKKYHQRPLPFIDWERLI